ncbi:hypothetical protein [Formosa sp. A9]|uniref:hypothetical protein n=1 Tax=Formosa sp. A9 TaxID=3442641 RepID=UPI003EBED98B
MKKLWKITAIKSAGQVAEGMWVEILKPSKMTKPSHTDIKLAMTEKYNLIAFPSNFSIFKME